MKLNKVKTVGDFMMYCKYPYWYQSKIKDMKLGDTLFIGQYREAINNSNEDYFTAEAWIEKHRGFFTFHATWTFPTKENRAFIMAFGKFKIQKSEILFDSGSEEKIKSFSLVCRYLQRILKSLSMKERLTYFSQGTAPLLMGVLVDKNWIGYKPSFKDNDIKQPYHVDYSNNSPHQLKSLVSVAMALGAIELKDN